ncbi:putative exonuclease VII, large subunit OB-fold nucleic acid binding domain [Hyphomicrobium sp. MC1]|nr:putative exonuclease VII, large subunit OB-fold nucleic acid binding domain [Hyphomicrobium sp. MC1]
MLAAAGAEKKDIHQVACCNPVVSVASPCSIGGETSKTAKENGKLLNSIPNTRESRSGANAPEFSVSELSGAIKRALEEGFGYVRLRGEISGYRGPHASGHCYFALKDDKAKIEAVVWKGTFGRLRFKPEEGMEVVAQGKITTFPGSSKYQIVIEALEPAGAGALMALLEERKRKFAAEGLFDEDRKRPRPFLPKIVGIVTSPTGAVIRDMLHGFNERFPTRVLLWPVRVQGEGSAAEVAAAIRGFNALEADGTIPRPDVLIVARGGGSLEDLWSFNEEIVVRAVAESTISLISAVGHETDWTLIDLVADARAPTPTKAAEWAVPKYSELIENVEKLMLRKRTAVRRAIESARTHLKASARGLPKLQDLVALPRQRFDAADRRLSRALLANTRAHATRLARVSGRLSPAPIVQKHSRCAERLDGLERRAGRALLNRVAVSRRVLEGRAALLKSLGYQSVLSRGFALVRNEAGHMVRQAASLVAGDVLNIEFSDGRVGATVNGSDVSSATPDVSNPTSSKVKTPRQKSSGRGGQGSLF